MIYIFIGSSRSGKSSIFTNSFLKNKSAKEFKDMLWITETDSCFLLGRYLNIDGRRKGTDLVSRKDIPLFFEQIERLYFKENKHIVIEGDKITSDVLLKKIHDSGMRAKLYLLDCTKENTIKRCLEANDNVNERNLKAVHTKCENRFNNWQSVFDGERIDTNNISDFTTIKIDVI